MKYRAINKIPLKGTISAVNYVTMKYGNRGATSGTGVIFTRDPNTGKIVFEPGSSERTVYGEFLAQAQGEDVVAGTRTPLSAIDMKENFLVPYNELRSGALLLEKYYGDMQDIEFTIDGNILYFLQARKGKRTARAEVTIGVDQVQERGITINEAILRFKDDASRLVELFFPQFDPEVLEAVRKGDREEKIIGKGLPAGPGQPLAGRSLIKRMR